MRTADFFFELPNNLIARYSQMERSSCRLLSLNGQTGALNHQVFTDLLDKLKPGDLMVFNNTKVIPARLFGHKVRGGRIEILIEKILDDKLVLAHVRSSKIPKDGSMMLLGDDNSITATMISRYGSLFKLRFDDPRDVLTLLNDAGHMPLPPYIDRPDDVVDREFYQTVYSERPGAVAAPTAGLHFDEPLMTSLRAKGVLMAFITLHVGTGTFKPVMVDQIKQHKMHSEYAEVTQEVVDAVLACKSRGNQVVAVGTTSARSLESAAASSSRENTLKPFFGDTNIFIYPGYKFRIIDALITNFHLPKSTSIMLVSALAGHRHTFAAYREAVSQAYRFFSYGDAMFITHNPAAAQELINSHD